MYCESVKYGGIKSSGSLFWKKFMAQSFQHRSQTSSRPGSSTLGNLLVNPLWFNSSSITRSRSSCRNVRCAGVFKSSNEKRLTVICTLLSCSRTGLVYCLLPFGQPIQILNVRSVGSEYGYFSIIPPLVPNACLTDGIFFAHLQSITKVG